MEALRASYGSDSDESDGSPSTSSIRSNGEDCKRAVKTEASDLLPPPLLDLLQPPNYIDYSSLTQGNRARSFPHVEGIYALHIYIPVYIPATARRLMVQTMKNVSSVVPSLYAVDTDFALNELCKDDCKLEKVLLSREFHISLGRTVGIQVDQIDSIVAMLRTKLHSQRQYWIEFDKWEVFVNDDSTRSFLSLEITGTGLQEITQQINVVDEVYRLHGLPEFYKDPRPHISLLWGPGDGRNNLKQAVVQIDRSRNSTGSSQGHNFKCKFSSIVCRLEFYLGFVVGTIEEDGRKRDQTVTELSAQTTAAGSQRIKVATETLVEGYNEKRARVELTGEGIGWRNREHRKGF